MKYLALGLIALGFMVVLTPETNAAVCHAGVYRAGCVGPRGGMVVRRRYPHYGANVCRWRAGRRVCY